MKKRKQQISRKEEKEKKKKKQTNKICGIRLFANSFCTKRIAQESTERKMFGKLSNYKNFQMLEESEKEQ